MLKRKIEKARQLFSEGFPLKRSLLAGALSIVGTISLIVALVTIIATFFIMQAYGERQAKQRLEELIDSMTPMASVAGFVKDATLAKETAQGFIRNSDVQGVTIIAEGHVLAVVSRGQADRGDDENRNAIVRRLYSPFDTTEVIGSIVVEPNWTSIRDKVNESVRQAATVLVLLASSMFAVLALVVTYRIVRPFKAIADATHHLDAASGQMLSVPEGYENNELGRLVGDINDLVERVRQALLHEHELDIQRVTNENLRVTAAVFEYSQEGIVITDRENRIVRVNRAFYQITGYREAEVIGKNPRLLSSGIHDRAFYDQMWDKILNEGYWKGEVWNRHKDGQIIPKWFSINVVRDEQGEIINFIAVFSDISERKKAEERIEFLAHHDPLTQLPNRILTRDRFEQAMALAIRDGSQVALLYIDLDNFKYINDTFGHPAGDKVLLSLVGNLRRHVRESDTVSRQGGDEFLLILPNIRGSEGISRIAQSILDDISLPIDIEGHQVGISASMGIVFFPDDGRDFDTLMKNADAAMYAAKSSGKNAFRFFTGEMSVDALEKLKLKAYLRTALEKGEFSLHYQPQVALDSGRLVGAEALLRWRQPELGQISPARFIPLAEESGLIQAIGEWVLEEVCRQGLKWLSEDMPALVLSANVSAQQFNRGNLHEVVSRVLTNTGYPPHLLELEFTESGLLSDVDRSVRMIEQLKSLGVKFAIDDFGTGYSSLSYLKQFKVEKLKIDQAFVRDIDEDIEDLEIVRAIIQLGKTLQLTVIAEGLESERQVKILQNLSCDDAQGYYISKPLPAAEFEQFAKRWQGWKKSAAQNEVRHALML